jgi:hypothetical protein
LDCIAVVRILPQLIKQLTFCIVRLCIFYIADGLTKHQPVVHFEASNRTSMGVRAWRNKIGASKLVN